MPQAGPAVALVAEHRLQRQDFAGLGVLKQAATDRQRLNWTAFQSDQWSTLDRCTSINFIDRPQREPLALEIIAQFTLNSTQAATKCQSSVCGSVNLYWRVLKLRWSTTSIYILQYATCLRWKEKTKTKDLITRNQESNTKHVGICWDSSWIHILIVTKYDKVWQSAVMIKWYQMIWLSLCRKSPCIVTPISEQPLTFSEAMVLQ